MKLRITCMECVKETGETPPDIQSIELRDDGLYSFTCPKGHTTLTVLQNQKFEILFDFGLMALVDGYTREAITNFASSLERFYGFYVFTTCLKHRMDIKDFQSVWRHVANQSERQFGAYLFLYQIDHVGEIAPLIDNEKPHLEGVSKTKTKTWKEFRNSVVHKGYIPSSAETIAYGNLVYQHINSLTVDLKSRSSTALDRATVHHLSRGNGITERMLTSVTSVSTILNVRRPAEPPETLSEAIEGVTEYSRRLR